MPLSKEIFDTLPDAVKADYAESNGQYVPVASLEAEKLSAKVTALKTSLDGLDSKLKAQAQAEAEKIEAARAAALEEAKSKGDVKAVEERYQQQMADLEKRVAEKTRQEVTQELTTKQAEREASSIADKIGLSLGIEKEDGEAIADLIRHRVKIDPATGKEIYHSADGSALSVDRAGFEAELKKEARFKRLIKGSLPTNGSGLANGNGGGGSAPNANGKAEEAKKKGDLNGFLKAHLTNT